MPTISIQMPTITPLAVQPSDSCLPAGELMRITEGCPHHVEGKLACIPGIKLCPFDAVKTLRPVLSPIEASKKMTLWEKGKMFVYNKLKPEDPDKVVNVDNQEEQIGYEFNTSQIKEFRKVFNAFDRDGNDSIGCDELGPVLSALGYSPSPNDIEKVLSRFDADHSGDLSFEEYLALMAVWVEEDETQIIEAFKVFDKSGDGYVTISELKRALCRFGEKFTDDEAEEFFDLIDANKDGIINYEEFVKYMLSEINRGPTPRAVTT